MATMTKTVAVRVSRPTPCFAARPAKRAATSSASAAAAPAEGAPFAAAPVGSAPSSRPFALPSRKRSHNKVARVDEATLTATVGPIATGSSSTVKASMLASSAASETAARTALAAWSVPGNACAKPTSAKPATISTAETQSLTNRVSSWYGAVVAPSTRTATKARHPRSTVRASRPKRPSAVPAAGTADSALAEGVSDNAAPPSAICASARSATSSLASFSPHLSTFPAAHSSPCAKGPAPTSPASRRQNPDDATACASGSSATRHIATQAKTRTFCAEPIVPAMPRDASASTPAHIRPHPAKGTSRAPAAGGSPWRPARLRCRGSIAPNIMQPNRANELAAPGENTRETPQAADTAPQTNRGASLRNARRMRGKCCRASHAKTANAAMRRVVSALPASVAETRKAC